ncbi:receptor-transporting protein 3-like [Terrapene carolina triunguis]|uniref:Receptor-transporting protein 3-like n=1 Tax=Terrapene triunguis TaxID=2587831 RepID=A0A674I3L4_9SAUR|nr:receptor-transporting protein 3-like [Terrapene carolina triunguis]
MEIWQQIFSQKIGQMKPGDRWTLKVDYNLQSNDLDPGWKQFLQQHAFARFQCSQCWHTWHSAQVNILFHMHLDRKQRRGQVKMKIFRQECKKCLVPKLELPEFSQENVERVLENLMLKIRGKCYREAINPHDLSKIIVEAQIMGPHDSSHCEACRLGICCLKYEAQAPASTFFRSASLLPRIFPAQEEWSEAETGSSRDSGSSCDWRRFCCYSCCLVIFLAVLIFVLLYFKNK